MTNSKVYEIPLSSSDPNSILPIRMENWSFEIDGKPILKHVSFSIEEGHFVTIVGPNGAGKTTLLKCLMRILIGGSGGIQIMGNPINSFSQRDLAKNMSYVPQAIGRKLPYTAIEFVTMGRYPYFNAFSPIKREDHEAVAKALEMVGMTDFEYRMMDTLSGGERQKIFIAAALAQETKIMLLDEPTAFLDPKHEDELHRLLAMVKKERGMTILTVTHDINHAALMSDRVLALKDGQCVFYGEPSQFMNDDLLYQLFGKRFLFVAHPTAGTPVVISDVWK